MVEQVRWADAWLRGHRPRSGDGEAAWRSYALYLQDRVRSSRDAAREAEQRADAADARARASEPRLLALRERGDEFHEMLQREETALRHERRTIGEVERLLSQDDAPGAIDLLAARRRLLASDRNK